MSNNWYEVEPDDSLESAKKAVALTYRESAAPVLKAKGEGGVAHEIIDLADQHGIYVAEDPALVELLSQLELEEEIPEALYRSVAVVLAWAYWIRGDDPSSAN